MDRSRSHSSSSLKFEITVTSTVPTARIDVGGALLQATPTRALGLAPMGIADAATTVHLNMIGADGDHTAGLLRALHRAPQFPVGVWGQPQHDDDRKLPAGDVVDAIDGITLSAVAAIVAGLPPIDYHRVEVRGPRHPLPFVNESAARPQMIAEADDVAAMLPPSPTDAQVFAAGAQWMARAGHGRTALAALRQERAGPPRFGSLTDGLAAATAARPPVAVRAAAVPTPVDTRVHAPVAIAVIRNPSPIVERPAVRTTASRGPAAALVTKASTLESVTAKLDLAVPAVLHRVAGASAQTHTGTIVATDTAPATRVARGRVAAVAARGAAAESRAHLKSVLASTPTPILAGDVVVLGFPNASRDLDDSAARPRLHITGGPARVVALGHGGDVWRIARRDRRFERPTSRRRRYGAAGRRGRRRRRRNRGVVGWHAGTALAYVGWSSALAAGSVVRAKPACARLDTGAPRTDPRQRTR
jgi:hypothetical protein